MIYQGVHEIVTDDIFLLLPRFADRADVELYLKIEALNPAGSIKLKPAVSMIEDAERDGLLVPASRIIESSSGNLGTALAMVCAAKGYPLTIVTDLNANRAAVDTMRCLGATVTVIATPDVGGGFLRSRIAHIHRALAADPSLVWLNQYANPANPRAHRTHTASSIHKEFGTVDVLFVGAGTTGTLIGCVDYFREHSPQTRIVAVDAEGSVTFGAPPGVRHLPGLGTSVRPAILRDDGGDYDTCQISEVDSIATCRETARRYGLLVGASTGSVLAAVRRLIPTIPPGSRIVAVSPDLGDRYLETVYNDRWTTSRYPSSGLPPIGDILA
ncbi:2,3-diaminopropionate biosynthesis protein SbnA [Micromonosporaceae bacterium B7E4]